MYRLLNWGHLFCYFIIILLFPHCFPGSLEILLTTFLNCCIIFSSSYEFILLSHTRVSTVGQLTCLEPRFRCAPDFQTCNSNDQNLGSIWGNDSRQKDSVHARLSRVTAPSECTACSQAWAAVARLSSVCPVSSPPTSC